MKSLFKYSITVFAIFLITLSCQKQVDYQPQINLLNNNITALQKSRDSLAAALALANNNINTTTNNVTAISKTLDTIKTQLSLILNLGNIKGQSIRIYM